MPKIVAVCISTQTGTRKKPASVGRLVRDQGLEGDAHAGTPRQVSLLSSQSIEKMRAKGLAVEYGMFAENLVVDGLAVEDVAIGQVYVLPSGAVLQVTVIGKPCHSPCEIFRAVGDCVMPREGIFARVLEGGEVRAGDPLEMKTS
ncbi:MAG: MOSC domain-containing protein [Planctomycetota bacterium]|jgi:MOSC domain-containing protein YiiM